MKIMRIYKGIAEMAGIYKIPIFLFNNWHIMNNKKLLYFSTSSPVCFPSTRDLLKQKKIPIHFFYYFTTIGGTDDKTHTT